MTTTISYSAMTAALDATGQQYVTLDLGPARILVMQRGGRVFGPFFADAPGLFWANAALNDATALQTFLDNDDWNLGGERLWIAPEIQFTIRDRRDFWGSYHLPDAMDPGDYTLTATGETITLSTTITLDAYNINSGQGTFAVEIALRPIADPLRAVVDQETLLHGVRYAGFSRDVVLRSMADTRIVGGSWVLVQLNPGGTIIIPANAKAQATSYMGDAPDAAFAVRDGAFRIPITGDRQFKTGYPAAHVTGRLGYLHPGDGESGYLLVRNFYNDPSSIYPEEPADQPGVNGDSIHVYNDDGGMGGFGELECQGRTIGGDSGLQEAADSFALWCYTGPVEKLEAIAQHLLV